RQGADVVGNGSGVAVNLQSADRAAEAADGGAAQFKRVVGIDLLGCAGIDDGVGIRILYWGGPVRLAVKNDGIPSAGRRQGGQAQVVVEPVQRVAPTRISQRARGRGANPVVVGRRQTALQRLEAEPYVEPAYLTLWGLNASASPREEFHERPRNRKK